MVEIRDEESTPAVDPLHYRTLAFEALVATTRRFSLALGWEGRYPADQGVDCCSPL